MTLQQILLKYWGYSSFRPMQEEIIRSVLDGNDTLALLPTGGGKSLTFQVPGLAREGLCLVISPLIALMKDQVFQLRKRGIPAAALYSGMHENEIDRVISNARSGEMKFLYLSPERLSTARMREALMRMKINLIAVDEAHCISQWGYDFRPPYLQISEVRQLLPDVPVLAVTATATPRVVRDIQEKLLFTRASVFRKSFERKNLTYVVIREEDKRKRLLKIIRKVKGCGVVYVRSRKETKVVAQFLKQNAVNADYYHAGLDQKIRDKRQKTWTESHDGVIVATNAFGMGIDKPDVRFVVHLDLPDCIEAYFQEAGRAGRDEKKAWAVLLYEEADILDTERNLETSFPEIDTIRTVYQALGNYYQLPVGSGKDLSFDFDLAKFSSRFGFQAVIAFNSLRFLEKEGYIVLTDAIHNPSRVYIRADKEELYRFQVASAYYDPFIKTLLRSYSGILTDFTAVNEAEIGRRANLPADTVKENLLYLEKQGLLDYLPQTDRPQVIFSRERIDTGELRITPSTYLNRKKEAHERLRAMISYADSFSKCRSQQLLAYFGECNVARCGKCDVCLERNKISLNEAEFDAVALVIKPLLKTRPYTLEELVTAADPIHEDKVILTMSWLLDTGKVVRVEEKYKWK